MPDATRDFHAEIVAATLTGDVARLAQLAHEFAGMAELARALEQRDSERKAKQAERTRRVRSRNATSRDVTLQGVTERDGNGTSPLVPPSPSPSAPTPSSPPYNPPSPAALTVARPLAKRPSDTPDVAIVMAHYREVHPRRRPGPKDEAVVRRALALGYAAAELCEAIDGNARDEWHRSKGKHELSYVLRDNGKIDDFRALADASKPVLAVDPATGLPNEAGLRMLMGAGR